MHLIASLRPPADSTSILRKTIVLFYCVRFSSGNFTVDFYLGISSQLQCTVFCKKKNSSLHIKWAQMCSSPLPPPSPSPPPLSPLVTFSFTPRPGEARSMPVTNRTCRGFRVIYLMLVKELLVTITFQITSKEKTRFVTTGRIDW